MGDVQHLLDYLVEQKRTERHLASFEHFAKTPNDLTRPAVCSNDVRKDVSYLGKIGRVLG